MKTKLTELTEQFGLTFEELLTAKNKYVDFSEMTGTGRNTWLTERGVEMLSIALAAEEVAPEVFEATVLHPATNPR